MGQHLKFRKKNLCNEIKSSKGGLNFYLVYLTILRGDMTKSYRNCNIA